MSVKLQKGQRVSLSKENKGLSNMIVGLGWDAAPQLSGGFSFFGRKKAETIDCDAFAIMLKNGKLMDEKNDIVYFGRLVHSSGSVKHMGDNLTGEGDGDDEQIVISLDKVPKEYDKIVIAVNIYRAGPKKQHFGMIRNAFVRLVDASTNREMYIYNLTESYPGKTAMIFGELYRHDGEWKFNAIGTGTGDLSIAEFARRYT